MRRKHSLWLMLPAVAAVFWLWPRDPVRVMRVGRLELRCRLEGLSRDDEFGHSVGAAKAGFIVGAPYHEGGIARLYSRACTPIAEWRGGPHDDLGAAVNGGGELVFVGIEREDGRGPGAVAIYSREALVRTIAGSIDRDLFGHAVASAGDVDRDGVEDVVIGAPGSWKKETIGYARIFSGKDGRALFTLQGERFAGDRFGFAVAGAGDVNRDGHDDVLIGSLGDTGHGAHSGRIYLFSGADGRKLRTIDGDSAHDELGHSVAGAGDLDGDGHPDLFAGAFLQKGIGYARAYSGRTGRVLFDLRGIEERDAFGHSVASAGDADGDGVMDLVVGAPDATVQGAARVGYVRIFSGKDGRVLLHQTGTRERMHYGYAVSPAGDVNGDFLADVLVGTVVVKDVGVAEVVSACAVDPIQVQGELTLRRTPGGFSVSGGTPGAGGVLLVEDETGRSLIDERFIFDSTTATVAFSMVRPALSGRTLWLSAVRTGTVARRSGKAKVRFCP